MHILYFSTWHMAVLWSRWSGLVRMRYFYQHFFPDCRWIVLTQSEISFFQISFNFVLREPLKVFEQRSRNNEITLPPHYCWIMFISISKGLVYEVVHSALKKNFLKQFLQQWDKLIDINAILINVTISFCESEA